MFSLYLGTVLSPHLSQFQLTGIIFEQCTLPAIFFLDCVNPSQDWVCFSCMVIMCFIMISVTCLYALLPFSSIMGWSFHFNFYFIYFYPELKKVELRTCFTGLILFIYFIINSTIFET